MNNPKADEVRANFKEGTAAYLDKNYDKAEKLLKKSIKGCPSCEAWLNLGLTYVAIKCFDEALTAFQSAIQCNPQYAEAWNNVGSVYHVQNNEAMADGFFRKALEICPDDTDANWNLSLSQLKRACDGEYSLFTEGWKRFESRFLKPGGVTMSARSKGARWVGQEGADKTLLVVFEQGIGDSIMFAR